MRRVFTAEAGGEIRTAEQSRATAKRLYERLVQHVSPVVGEAGFDALFARSLKKIRPSFSFLRELEAGGPAYDVSIHFFESLGKQKLDVVNQVAVDISVAFADLLSTFIGEGLTWKLLRDAWPEVLPGESPSGER